MLPLHAHFVLWSLPVVAPTSAHPGNRQEVVSPAAGAEWNGGRGLWRKGRSELEVGRRHPMSEGAGGNV